jgi:hypothetical protein
LQGNDQFTVAPIIRSTFLHAWKVNQPNFAWCFVATSQEPSVSYISASCLWKACFDKLHKCSCVYIADWDVTCWCHDWVFLLLLEMCWKRRTQILVSIFSSKFLVHYMVNYIQFRSWWSQQGEMTASYCCSWWMWWADTCVRVTNHKVMTTVCREKWQLATAVHDECDDLILCESDKSQGYDCIFFLVMFVCWLELMQHLFAC